MKHVKTKIKYDIPVNKTADGGLLISFDNENSLLLLPDKVVITHGILLSSISNWSHTDFLKRYPDRSDAVLADTWKAGCNRMRELIRRHYPPTPTLFEDLKTITDKMSPETYRDSGPKGSGWAIMSCCHTPVGYDHKDDCSYILEIEPALERIRKHLEAIND